VDDLHLVRDLLDKQLVDRENRPMGKVDGLTLEFDRAGRPRIASLDVGPTALAGRLSPRLERIVARASRRLGVSDGKPERFSPGKIVHFGNEVKLDVDAPPTKVYAWERWLRAKLISRLPGSGAKG
jgi:hypothetical protein